MENGCGFQGVPNPSKSTPKKYLNSVNLLCINV